MISLIHEPTFHVNSSSSHKFFYDPRASHQDDYYDSDFGWSGKVASIESKIMYAANMIRYMTKNNQKLIHNLFLSFGINLRNKSLDTWQRYTIDHQSLDAYEWGEFCLGKFRRFFFWFMQPMVGVFLENNNEEFQNSVTSEGKVIYPDQIYDETKDFDYRFQVLGPSDDPDGVVVTGQSFGTYRIILDKSHGFRNIYPEAIDLKITDYCDKGCPFCYQQSGPTGTHARAYLTHLLFYEMRQYGVTQVALGGGEPTKYHEKCYSHKGQGKDWRDIVDVAFLYNVLPSMTTGSLDWCIANDKRTESALMNMGGISYSVQNFQDAIQWREKVQLLRNSYAKVPQFSANIIPEIMNNEEIRKIATILSEESINLLFLGYKNFGRAKNINQSLNNNWTEVIPELKTRGVILSADTLMAENYPEIFNNADIIPAEGKRTMYIDAVKEVKGPHSYTEELTTIRDNGTLTWEKIVEDFPY